MSLSDYHQSKMNNLTKDLENAGLKVSKNVPLELHTTFKIGGPAELFISVTKREDLVKTIEIARSFDLPHFLLGGGSNLLVRDNGIKGIVIHDKTTGFTIDKNNKTIQINSGQPLAPMAGRETRDIFG